MNKKTIIKSIFVLITIAIFIASIGLFYDPFSECPIRYRFEFENRCWLRDDRKGTKLIEIYRFDDSRLWLAKIDSKKVTWIEHPAKYIDTYKNHIPENEIVFKDDSLDTLIVNGILFPVTVLEKRL